jgi:hypothetical protein
MSPGAADNPPVEEEPRTLASISITQKDMKLSYKSFTRQGLRDTDAFSTPERMLLFVCACPGTDSES